MTIRVVEHEGGWLQVDIRVRLPDGTRYRERSRAPVQSKSGARRWAEERERYLALSGPKQPKKEVPTLEDFESRFISEHVEANQLKPSTAASYKSRLKNHIRPNLGRLRLDEIDKQSEQRLKAAMKQFDPGTGAEVEKEVGSWRGRLTARDRELVGHLGLVSPSRSRSTASRSSSRSTNIDQAGVSRRNRYCRGSTLAVVWSWPKEASQSGPGGATRRSRCARNLSTSRICIGPRSCCVRSKNIGRASC